MKPTAQPHAASTDHMVDYDHNSFMQDQLVLSHGRRIAGLVEKIGAVEPEFTLADYGCGPGHSAIDAVRPAIESYRRISPDGPMVVRHADQPGNDWSGLLALAFGPDGYQHEGSGIRTETAVGSFYNDMAAPGSVTLATSFVACHWLSRAVSPHSPGTIWFADLQGAARAEVAAVASADRVQFLRCRARELQPGGYLLVSTIGGVPDATEPNGIRVSCAGLMRAAFAVAQGMADEGLLDQSALDHFVIGEWFPTEAEVLAPIESEPDLAAAFELVEASVVPAATNPDDVYAHEIGDPALYARRYAGYLRGFAESSLRMHLFAPSAKTAEATDGLTAEFFRRITALYQAEPGRHASETLTMTLVLRRR